VTDLNAAVCDTHALVFHAAGDRRLGPRARAVLDACEARRTIVYVPVAVLWELGLLERRGRIALGRSLASFAEDLFGGRTTIHSTRSSWPPRSRSACRSSRATGASPTRSW
jgi:PIN domain nuclease of toxin-antitoxin system